MKQVLTILLAVVLFRLTITVTNAIGIALTLVGGASYATVEYRQKARRGADKSLEDGSDDLGKAWDGKARGVKLSITKSQSARF